MRVTGPVVWKRRISYMSPGMTTWGPRCHKEQEQKGRRRLSELSWTEWHRLMPDVGYGEEATHAALTLEEAGGRRWQGKRTPGRKVLDAWHECGL